MMIFLSRWCCRFGSRSSSNSYNVFTTSTGLRTAATKTTTRWATSSTVTTTNNAGAINNAVAAAVSNKPVTVLVLDTETTGKVKFNKPYTDKEQPDLVQLGFLLVDCNNNNNNKITDNNNNDDDCYNNSNNNNVIWKPRLKVSLLVNDDNNHVIIEKGAFETHGISTEDCQRYGVPRTIVLDLFHSACQQADILVGHNLQFDVTVMKTAWYRQQQQQLTSEDHKGPDKQPLALVENLLPRKSICTMQASTDILRLPSPYKKKTYKWPTLQEAYSHFANTAENDNNNEIKDAHDALGDAQACLTIFRGLVETGAIQITDDKDYDDDHDEQRKSNDDNKSLHHHELSASTSSPSSSIAKTAANITSIDEEKPTTTTTNNLPPRKDLRIELEQHGFYVSGSTYQYKDDLKNLGAKWNPKMKAWNFKDHYQLEAVMEFIGIPITNGGGSSADEHMVHYYLKHKIDINDNN